MITKEQKRGEISFRMIGRPINYGRRQTLTEGNNIRQAYINSYGIEYMAKALIVINECLKSQNSDGICVNIQL